MFFVRRYKIERTDPDTPAIDPEVAAHLADSYPHNHNVEIVSDALIAKRKLAARYKRITRLYPEPVSSLLDVSCSKGFFVADAAVRPSCERALGIDIDDNDLRACEAIKAFLPADRARFIKLQLHELAERIGGFGGPFQTSLVINSYQYFYFGSSRSSDCYLDHREIFHMLRQVCDGRVIFSNRMELNRVQTYCKQAAERHGHDERRYSTETAMAAASEFFEVTRQGKLGNLPIWTLNAR